MSSDKEIFCVPVLPKKVVASNLHFVHFDREWWNQWRNLLAISLKYFQHSRYSDRNWYMMTFNNCASLFIALNWTETVHHIKFLQPKYLENMITIILKSSKPRFHATTLFLSNYYHTINILQVHLEKPKIECVKAENFLQNCSNWKACYLFVGRV